MKKASLILLCLVGFGLVVAAQSNGVFERFDRDSDGKVTPREFPDAKAFARYDLDKDGAITLAEYQKVAGITATAAPAGEDNATNLDRLVTALDRNSDGRISREEAGDAKWFSRLDRNRNDFIDAAELDQLRRLGTRLRNGRQMPEVEVNADQLAKVTSGPEVIKPGEAGIGRMVEDFEFVDINGKAGQLSELGERGVVIAMTSSTCPVASKQMPSLAGLAKQLEAQGIGLLLVNPFRSEKLEDIRAQLQEHLITAPYIHEGGMKIAASLQAQTNTEVFLIDASRTLIYRGALDDQFGINYTLDAPRHEYLKDAVIAMLNHRRPQIAATRPAGCEVDLPKDNNATETTLVTYHKDVARILQQNCVECHREDGIAPFSLADYDEVIDRVRVIRRVVTEGTMPPWFAAPTKGASLWANDCSLSERDKSDLLAWLNSSDRPMGDPKDAPSSLTFPEEWSIGEPDLVLQLSRSFNIKATGVMPYQYDVVETKLTEDKWVSAYEIQPSVRAVVHHVIVQVHEPGTEIRNRGEGAGGYWAAYVPGNSARTYPEGFARKLPAGSRISFQIHYTPNGTATQERLKMGLVFADKAPRFEVKTTGIADSRLDIPPGASHHIEGTTLRVPSDIPITGFMAHMHVRGKAFKYELILPNGDVETLLDIPRYDFNWQLQYELKEPKLIPAGSTIKVTGVFDNSSANRANPDPTKTVHWGDQTYDEMLIGYVDYFVPVAEKSLAAR